MHQTATNFRNWAEALSSSNSILVPPCEFLFKCTMYKYTYLLTNLVVRVAAAAAELPPDSQLDAVSGSSYQTDSISLTQSCHQLIIDLLRQTSQQPVLHQHNTYTH